MRHAEASLTREDIRALSEISYSSIAVGQIRFILHGLRFDGSAPQERVMPPHMHDFFEMQYILSGTMVSTVSGVTRSYQANQYYVIPPLALHSHRTSVPTEGFTIRFALERMGESGFDPDIEMVKYTMDHVQAIVMEDADGTLLKAMAGVVRKYAAQASRLTTLLALLSLICDVSGRYRDMLFPTIHASSRTSPSDSILARALAFIEQRFTEPITAADVAAAVPISLSHLEKVFNRNMNESIKMYMRRVRLDKAVHLIMTTDLDIDSIAKQSGFSSASYFSQVFRDVFGEAPTRFRGHYQQNYFKLDVSIR